MADVIDPFNWSPKEAPKEKKAATKTKGVEVADPFIWEPKGKEKAQVVTKEERPIDTLKRGAVKMADATMGAFGVDLRKPEGTTRKPSNFIEGMVQDTAKASREEVNEQRKVGIGKAIAGRAVGAAVGLPILGHDVRNAMAGVAYKAGEVAKPLNQGNNPIQQLWDEAERVDARGNKTAPALGALLGSLGINRPTDAADRIRGGAAELTGAPKATESGSADVLNAIPMGGPATRGAARGLTAAAKEAAKAGLGMGALAGAQVAGTETARSGKTFSSKNALTAAAQAGIVGGAAGGIVHLGAQGFTKIPKSAGRKAEAHARDTIVSTTPIEPVGKDVHKPTDKAYDDYYANVDAELKADQSRRNDKYFRQEHEAEVLKQKQALDEIDRQLAAKGGRPYFTGEEMLPGAAERQAQGGKMFEQRKAMGEGKKAADDAYFAETDAELQADSSRRDQQKFQAAHDEALSKRLGFKNVGEYTKWRDSQPLAHPDEVAKTLGDDFVPEPAKLEKPAKAKKAALDSEQNVKPDVRELKAQAEDRSTLTPEKRRQAQIKLKETTGEQREGAIVKRYSKIDADKPPESPKAPPPKEDGVITRAEFKRRTVKESRPATAEESGRYQAVADATAEADYHQRRYETLLKEVADELGVEKPTELKRGSHDKALSPESGEINKAIAEKITKMREAAGFSDEPSIDVYDKTFMGEHNFEPLQGKTPKEKLAELEGIEREAGRWKKEADSQARFVKGEWKAVNEESYKVGDKTYLPVEVTAGDGTKHHVNVITKEGGKNVLTPAKARERAIKQVQSEYGSVKEGAHPRAITVRTPRGEVLLESFKRKPSFDARELKRAEVAAGDNADFAQAKQEFLELKPKRDKAGEYVGVNYGKLHEVLSRFITEEHGHGVNLGILGYDAVKAAGKTAKEIGDIWATHTVNKAKAALDEFFQDEKISREITGNKDPGKLAKIGDAVRIALAQKNDMDWVRSYNRDLAEGLESIRSRMDNLGQGVEKLSDAIRAREEFADAIEMTPQEVRDHNWQHLTKDQVNFIADVSELRAEASDMISDVWDLWNDAGMPDRFERRHLEGLYKQYTGGVDIRTGLREKKSAIALLNDHLQTGTYDALVTGNKRIHTLHIADALTMGTSVVHPMNLAKAAKEYFFNKEIREFLKSYQGAGVYKQTRGSKISLWEKSVGKAVELSLEKLVGKGALDKLRLLEGGVLEDRKIEFIRGAAILRAGKEMGYKGNILQDVAREYATGKNILTPAEHTELSIRVLNQLEDAFGYNPAGFVNRNAFRQIGLDRVFPFMGIRSVQNRLFGKFIAERNFKALLTLSVATQAFAGSNALMAPVENALQAVSPELYIQVKELMDFLSIAGLAEAGGKATGLINEENEQGWAPFLRRIEHIQPEVIPWLYNPPNILMDVFDKNDTTLRTNILRLSAVAGGSNIAKITTPTELESLWRYLDKAKDGKVENITDERGQKKQIGGKKMAVYQKEPFGEKRIGSKQHIETTYFREFMNHLLPKADAIDERYASEAKFAAAAKTALMRRGYDAKEIKSMFKELYEPLHWNKHAATGHDFLELLKEHPKKN